MLLNLSGNDKLLITSIFNIHVCCSSNTLASEFRNAISSFCSHPLCGDTLLTWCLIRTTNKQISWACFSGISSILGCIWQKYSLKQHNNTSSVLLWVNCNLVFLLMTCYETLTRPLPRPIDHSLYCAFCKFYHCIFLNITWMWLRVYLLAWYENPADDSKIW